MALNGVPIDVLAARLETTRGALYKTIHDARRKLRASLAEQGLGFDREPDPTEVADERRRPRRLIGNLLGPDEPELSCERCFELLDRYVELELDATGRMPMRRSPGCVRISKAVRRAPRTTTACGRWSRRTDVRPRRRGRQGGTSPRQGANLVLDYRRRPSGRRGPRPSFGDRLKTDPAFQAFTLLRVGFTVAPILFGLDKFFNVMVDWPIYLAPWINDVVPGSGADAMHMVGVIEIAAGVRSR